MTKKEYISKAQREAIKEALEQTKIDYTTGIKESFMTIGDPFFPRLVVIDKGKLGIDLVDRDGKLMWLNQIGEHKLLSFLIDKQYHVNIVRNSKEITNE